MIDVAEKRKKDRHKNSAFQLRLHPLLRDRLRTLAERNFTTVTAEVVFAIRKHLAENNLWPPAHRKES